MEEQMVILKTKSGKGSGNKGTKLIPFFDSVSGLSVETIGSYFAPKCYRALSELIFDDKTTHKEVKYFHWEERRERRALSSPPKSLAQKRHPFVPQINDNQTSGDFTDLIDSIEDELIPDDKFIFRCIQTVAAKYKGRSHELETDAVVEAFVDEAKRSYAHGVKRAIVEYVLLNQQERLRLKIPEELVQREEPYHIPSPVFWRPSFISAKSCCETNNLTLMETLNQVRVLWYENFYSVFYLRGISFPADPNDFKSQVTLNCQKMKFKLIYEWVSAVTGLIVENRVDLFHPTDDSNRHYLDTLATLMGRLLRQLVVDNIEDWVSTTKRSVENKDEVLFTVKALFCSPSHPLEKCLDPSPSQWPDIVLHPIKEILKATECVPRVEQQLTLNPKEIFTKTVSKIHENDWEVMTLEHQLLEMLNESNSFRILESNLKQKSVTKTSRSKNIESLRKRITQEDLFEGFKVLDHKWVSGIFLIDYKEFNQTMASRTLSGTQELIKSKVHEIISLGQRICDTLREMRDRIEKVTNSTADLVDNIRLIDENRAKCSLLFVDIEYVQDHWGFLVEEGASYLSDGDFELLHKLYNWPEVIKGVIEESEHRLGTSKQRTEHRLRERIAIFHSKLRSLEEKVMIFKKKRLSSPLEKAPENVEALNRIDLEIKEATREQAEINSEETLLGFVQVTKFPQLRKIKCMKQPLDLLWKTAATYEVKSEQWMTNKFQDVDLLEVREEVEDLLSRVAQIGHKAEVKEKEAVDGKEGEEEEGTDSENEELKANIATLRARISGFKQYRLPLLQVISLPILRDKHWKQMSSVLKHDVGPQNIETLADMTPNLREEDITKITEIGKRAASEYALEVFLEKMKNEWLEEWPTDALDIAANRFLEEENMETELKQNLSIGFKYIHDFARNYAALGQWGENADFPFPVKVTPPFFVDFILSFKELLKKKQTLIISQKARYEGGVEKLDLAGSFVESMKRKLIEEYQPQLLVTSKETEVLMVRIEKETVDVESTKERIGADEASANQSAGTSQQMRDDCTKELAEAVPAMESATKALDTLNEKDIVFLRTMKNPPLGVKMVLESVAILLAFPPERRPDPNGSGRLVDDYWSSSLKMINSANVNLLDALKNYDKHHVPETAIRLVRESYLSCPEYDPEALMSVSEACRSIAKWVKALDIYDRVINVIKPKKAKLLEAERDLATLMERLFAKKSQLQDITDKLQGLSDEFASVSKKKKDLEDNMEMSQTKINRAEQLIDGLEQEKKRWTEVTHSLTRSEETIIGDMLLSAALVVYLSGMSSNHRNHCLYDWQKYINTKCDLISCDPFNVINVLGVPLDIQTWIVAGLSTDHYSTENAIIMSNSRKYCLIIDPLKAANKWLKRLNSDMFVMKNVINEQTIRRLKESIAEGRPVLLEEVNPITLKHPFIDRMLRKNIVTDDQQKQLLCLDGEEIECSPQFQFYMTCTQFIELPLIVSTKLTIINWSDDYGVENGPKNGSERTIRLEERAKKERKLIELENLLLEMLSSAEIDALEDEDAMKLLIKYKDLASELAQEV